MLSNIVWANQVVVAAQLVDERLSKRMAAMLVDKMESPCASIPQALRGDAGQAKATYRFYANRRVPNAHVQRGFALATAQHCLEHQVVLNVQDSTTLNFTGLHPIHELGPIDSGNFARGMHLHTTLAITTEGRVIGVVDQQCWARPQISTDSDKQQADQEKESAKWVHGLDHCRAALYEAAAQSGRAVPHLIHVMDREGDAYEVMMAIEEAGDSAIIRCAQDRRIQEGQGKAHATIRSQPLLCTARITVPRQGATPKREALVEVRSLEVHLVPDLRKYPHAWPMSWRLVEVWESTTAAGSEPLHWLLWTREVAATPTQALEVVRLYTCRWPIEEMHLVLKSGCKTEDLRLESWDRLEKAVRMNTAIAARIVSLRDIARDTPEAPALNVLESEEVEVLVQHFGKGKPLPAQQLTIAQAVLWIGRLGGHLNRKGDGMPGVRTLWRGLQSLSLLVTGFRAGKRVRE